MILNTPFPHQGPPSFVYWDIQIRGRRFFMLSEEWKRDLALAAACTGGLAVLLAPASVVTLGLGIVLG